MGKASYVGGYRAGLWHGAAASWEDLASVLTGQWCYTYALAVWTEATTIYVAGYGYNADAFREEAILWTRPIAPVCPADLTGDGVIDFGDYLEFLNIFDALDPRADLIHDGVIDFGDYLEFLNLFEAGC